MSPSPKDMPAQAGGVIGGKCPFMRVQEAVAEQPQKLNLKVLNPPKYLNGTQSEYAKDFAKLDLPALKADLAAMMKDSKDWWPADYGHYGPFMLRLAWHSAGTYRTFDGRGGANAGNQRFNPLDSWPDNGNLDKARRLLWPIKQKYGKKISWGDLMILAGNVGMEDMGLPQFGFAGGRVDCWASEEDVYWGSGPEGSFSGLANDPSKLEKPLGAAQMELIYVNPEGPDAVPDPILAAAHIRETFGRMAMNDEETVSLVAGGHTFGKAHGVAPGSNCGPRPSEAPVEQQGFGWTSSYKSGKGADAITSGLEGAWTAYPTKWDHGYFTNLFKYEYELCKGPGGANQWRPKDGGGADTIPDAHDPDLKHQPMMFTTDMALIKDPAYLKISERFRDDPDYFAQTYAKAWYKLCHRDMGPAVRCLGPEVAPEQIWQDPIPKGPSPSDSVVASVKQALSASGFSNTQLVRTAWASAATFRHTDFRGGCNGARLRLAPQKDWAVNEPAELATILAKYEEIQAANGGADAISMADIIVLAGCVGVEQAAAAGGVSVQVPFLPGRGDATAEQTDVASFDVLEPKTDAFRNYNATAHDLVDRACLMKLSAPEMSVLVAGMRAMDCNATAAGKLGILTETPGVLNNAFFTTLLGMDSEWKRTGAIYEAKSRADGSTKWTASNVDLTFGSNPELRAIAEHYSMSDSAELFVQDFVAAWAKVMNSDRYDYQ